MDSITRICQPFLNPKFNLGKLTCKLGSYKVPAQEPSSKKKIILQGEKLEESNVGIIFEKLVLLNSHPQKIRGYLGWQMRQILEKNSSPELLKSIITLSLKQKDMGPVLVAIHLLTMEKIKEMSKEGVDPSLLENLADNPFYHDHNSPQTSHPITGYLLDFPFELCRRIFSVFITDADDRPKTIWELTLTLQGFYTLFYQIPKALFLPVTKSVKTPWKVYTIAGSVALVGLSTLYIYVRWFRSAPKKVRFAEYIEPSPHKSLRQKDCQIITSKLERGQHVVLLGESGVGKTALLEDIASNYTKKLVYRLKGSSIVHGDGGYGGNAKNRLNKQTLKDLIGFEGKVLFVVDEANDFLSDKSLLADLLCWTNSSHSDWQFLFATTEEQYETFKNKKDNPPLDRRFFKHHIQEMDENQTISVMKEHLREQKNPYLLEKKFLRKIYKESKDCPGGQQPAKAKHFLEVILGEWDAKRHHKDDRKWDMPTIGEITEQSLRQMETYQNQRKEAEEEWGKREKKIKKLDSLLYTRLRFLDESIRLARAMKKGGLSGTNERALIEKALYFTAFILIPTVQQIALEKSDKYEIPVKIPKKFVKERGGVTEK